MKSFRLLRPLTGVQIVNLPQETAIVNPAVPREKIPWFPAIDADLCIGDQDCVNFCRNDVLGFDEHSSKVIVVHPYNCVLGCDSCAKICPQEAIHFPSQEDLRTTLRKLRADALPSGHEANPHANAPHREDPSENSQQKSSLANGRNEPTRASMTVLE